MKKIAMLVALALGVTTGAASAITIDAGWNSDAATGLNGLSADSQINFYDFTLTGSAIFTYTDCCRADDQYEILNFGSIIQTSSLIAGTSFGDTLGEFQDTYNPSWESSVYHGGQILLSAGTYEIDIRSTTDSTGGIGVRLDTVISAVPVPASLPLLMLGLGGFGAIARRKKSS